MDTRNNAEHEIVLPQAWRAAMDTVAPEQARRLSQAWHLSATDPLRAARLAEELFLELHENEGMAPWMALEMAISGRIHTLSSFTRLDPLLDFFQAKRAQLVAPQELLLRIDACYFGGLVFRRPGHPDIKRWAQACLQAFQCEGEAYPRLCAANYLLLYRIWNGDLLGADALRRQMAPLREKTDDIRTQLLCHSISAISLRLFVDYKGCQREIQQGLALAERSGLHFWDSHLYMQAAALTLCRENLKEAEQWLERMETAAPPEHHLDRSGYHYMRAWLYMITDESALALTHAKEAVRLADESGAVYPQAITYMGLAQLYLDRRQLGHAFYHIGRARRIGKAMASHHGIAFARGLAQAHVSFKLGMRKRALTALTHALAIGREQRYLNFPWWRSHFMSGLCARALENDIEPDYVRWLVRQRRLQPPADLSEPELWSWPLSVEILGTPKIVLDDETLEVGNKTHGLILALASLGDGERWVDRVRLADLLWPDSDGDRAQRSLDTAIHRLRKQLGSEAMILTRSGAVALNAGLCRVDYWWLLRELNSDRSNARSVARLVEAAMQLGNGSDNGFVATDQLKRRIALKVLELVGGHLRGTPQTEQWLEALLSVMPEQERLWQALIRHHSEQGLASGAIDAWHRCEAALRESAGIKPAPATYAIVKPWLKTASGFG